jgi:hypothetical protein
MSFILLLAFKLAVLMFYALFLSFDHRPRHKKIALHLTTQGLGPPEFQKFEEIRINPNLERFLGSLLAEGLAANLR